MFPDNQYYTDATQGGSPDYNTAIVNQCVSWASDFIVGVGDNMQNTSLSTDQTNVATWVGQLNATGIKWITPPGNHDYDDRSDGSGALSNARTNAIWSGSVGVAMTAEPGYGGSYPGSGSYVNTWMDMGTHGGFHWGVIALEYCPRPAALTWAAGVLAANPTINFIVSTHDYVTETGILSTDSYDTYNCVVEGLSGGTNFTSGATQWSSFYSLHDDQIRLVLNGHWNPASNFSNRRIDVGTHGNNVSGVYFDPQSYTHGGDGFMRLLNFYSDGTVAFQTYSPTNGTYLTDGQNQFTLDLNPLIGASTPAAAPTFLPAAGTYTGTQSIAISTTSGTVICYNTTGSPATNGTTGCTMGTLYSGAVSVAASETLYAIAGGTGFTDSSVSSAAYTINPPPTTIAHASGKISASGKVTINQ